MTRIRDLFGERVRHAQMLRAPVRRSDPVTSRAAAGVICGSRGAGSLPARVLDALRGRAMADFELAKALGLREEQVRKRRSDWTHCKPPSVRDTGRRVTNPDTGMEQNVWEVIP